jgi:hypothetical protein
MTLIVDYETKKALKEAVKSEPEKVWITAPGLHKGSEQGYLPSVLEKHALLTVTNMPKRSFFANIKRNKKGIIVVT